MIRYAHIDTFARDHLPPAEQMPDFLFNLPELRYPDRLNCVTAFVDDWVAAGEGGRDCLMSPHERLSYADLAERVNRIANVLTRDLGIVPGNRVLLRGPNNPWLAACWLGVLKAGGVAVATMSLLRAGELATIGQVARPRLALCDHRFTAELAAAGVDGLQVVEYGGPGPGDLAQRAARMPGDFAAVATAADDVAMLASTSGTTGQPKVAVHFHRDVLATCDTFSHYLIKPHRDDVFTGTPPLGFTYGLGGLVLFPLRVGAAAILLEKASPEDLLPAIESFSATICFTGLT